MNHHTGYKSLVADRVQAAAFMLALACALVSTAPGATKEELRTRGGLRNSKSQPLSASELQILLKSLRHKTGLAEMQFDENGFLAAGETHNPGGSAVARALILATIDGNRTFELERHSGSPTVAFAQLVPMEHKENNEIRYRAGLIQLDFEDFTHLDAGREVVDAFDPGIAVIHELVHGILGLTDALGGKTQLGECDEYVNRIRRELDLPERPHYSPQIIQPTPSKRVLLAQISFVRTSDHRRFHLR